MYRPSVTGFILKLTLNSVPFYLKMQGTKKGHLENVVTILKGVYKIHCFSITRIGLQICSKIGNEKCILLKESMF